MDRVLTNGLVKVNRVQALSPEFGMKIVALALAASIALIGASDVRGAEEEPAALIPEVVDFSKLLPLLPEAPADWTADKAEGSTDDAGGVKITSVHRDYKKGTADNAPTTSISILDSAANPEYVAATTAAWNLTATTPEGYTKALTVEGMPGFETFENEGKHGTLWLMVAKRYVLQIETQSQESKDLQDWLKRIDLKKLAAVK
ncbi:MAG: hypothetical protein DMF06_08935 [Verrucomicrobia bacterium]|nr:MAG: hypothetical protein DMF06_08935 [Verrucomicrobiota bacterium]